jgi:ATP-dependent DNA helicase RecQ
VHVKSGFGFGLNHIVEVLTGAKSEAVRQRGHDTLSTYGIGGEIKREAWQAIGRELLRLGLVEAAPGKFATLQLTEAGLVALRERTSITLTKPAEVAAKTRSRAGAIETDEKLFDQLRTLRREIADERDVPAYVIFSDVALREMARSYPTSSADFRRIPGVGEQKLKDFAEPFLGAIRAYLEANPRQTFGPAAAPSAAPRRKLNDSEAETLRRFLSGESIDEIARTRGFVRGTICTHLALAIEGGAPLTLSRFFDADQQAEIAVAYARHGGANLAGLRDSLGGNYGIDDLRLFRAFASRAPSPETD